MSEEDFNLFRLLFFLFLNENEKKGEKNTFRPFRWKWKNSLPRKFNQSPADDGTLAEAWCSSHLGFGIAGIFLSTRR